MKRTLVWEPYSSSTAYKMCALDTRNSENGADICSDYNNKEL